jgi:hypothetical protein
VAKSLGLLIGEQLQTIAQRLQRACHWPAKALPSILYDLFLDPPAFLHADMQ